MVRHIQIDPTPAEELVPLFQDSPVISPVQIDRIFHITDFIFPCQVQFYTSIQQIADIGTRSAIGTCQVYGHFGRTVHAGT